MKLSAAVLTTLLASAFARPDANGSSPKLRSHARDVRAPYDAVVRPRWTPQPNRREVPQEHSHQKFLTQVTISLNLNNPDQIADAVFGLLGNAAAAGGAGNIADKDCLQQATADQAFTNAKAAGDVTGMTAALVYRALERNTGAVGQASVLCTSVTAVNPEIAALQQHQDPASDNAAAVNKQITLTLAIQIASIGGDPTIALESGTFAPGQIGDPTAAGNTCDDPNDAVGCIETLGLLVEDATVDEIMAAVAGASTGAGAAVAGDAPAETAGQVVSNATLVASETLASSTDDLVSTETVANAAISTVTMVVTDTLTQCATTSAPPVGMTAITMPTAAASSIISIAISLGIEININDGSNVAITYSALAGQTAVQIQTNAGLATATITGVAAAVTSSADCSEAISSALAAAGLSGAMTTSPAIPPAPQAADPASNGTAASSTLDLGSCADPTIIFADNLDGRNEPSFAPADETTFTHGSALGIKVITDFICQQLDVKCKASTDTIDACNQGAAAAQGATGQAAADAFNAALGF